MTTSAPSSRLQSILVALDESPRAASVFAAALLLARSTGARVTQIRVLTTPVDIPAAAHTPPSHLGRDVEQTVRAEFQELKDTAPDVAFGPAVILDGDPWRKILEIAVQMDVDLIVMGSHRYHGVERVLGTVASRVVNHADRNVLVVHERTPT